jgi:hypothetical protein
MTAQVFAALFCTDCGRELPSPGEACPACPQLDDRRREIVRASAALLGQLRAIDVEENAKALRDAAGAARALVTPVQAQTGPLEKAVTDAITAEREAADKARGAERYAGKVTRAEEKARRDEAGPEALTEALLRKRAAAEVAADVSAAATRATAARAAAEEALALHLARVASLEDAAVAAERAAATPPATVPPGVFTCLLGNPLQLLLSDDLEASGRALVAAQITNLAKLAGVADELRAEGRAQLEAEQADPARHRAQLQVLGNGNIGVLPNPMHPGTPTPTDPRGPGAGQGFAPPLTPRLGT